MADKMKVRGVGCIRCRKVGTVGIDIILKRDGMVPGSKDIPRYIALCNDCTRTENQKDEYKRATSRASAEQADLA